MYNLEIKNIINKFIHDDTTELRFPCIKARKFSVHSNNIDELLATLFVTVA